MAPWLPPSSSPTPVNAPDLTRSCTRRHNLRVDLSNKLVVQAGMQLGLALFTAGVTVGAVRTSLSGLVRRTKRLEDQFDELPKNYVPRSEVERALNYLTEITTGIRHSIDAYFAGHRAAWSGSLLASAETSVYDPVSEQRLALVHPDLARRVHAALDALAQHGTFFRVAQGLRTFAEQDALYAQGRTAAGHVVTNARGGWSNHNFGCAVDCYPFLQGRSGDVNFNPSSVQFQAMVVALKAQGLAWGGDWHDPVDPPHFQLAHVPVTPTDADRAAFVRGGLKAVWAQYSPTIHAAAEDGPQLTIRFIAESDLISEAIRKVTFSEWSHVELLTPENTWLGAHSDGGVEERAFDYCTPDRERRYSLPVTQDQLDRMLAYARGQIGTRYAFKDIAGLLLHEDLTESDRLICSWFVYNVLWAGGLFPLNVLPGYANLVTPETLHLSPVFIDHCTFELPEKA